MARYSDERNTVFSIQGINAELEKVSNTQEDHLSRKPGDSPNMMETDLDMNSNRIFNLPTPITDNEPLTKSAGEGILDGATQQANRAEAEADRAEEYAIDNSEQVNQFTDFLTDAYIDLNAAIENTGWFPVSGSFESGGTITERNQVLLLQNADGSNGAGYYSWGGALPKTVAAASSPNSTGGTPQDGTGWTYRADAKLRTDLAPLGSEALVAGVEAQALRRVPPYQYEQMGVAFRSDDIDAPVQDDAGMWPHANVSYDEDDDKFVVLYNINDGHDIYSNRVLMRKKDPEGQFSQATVVADRISQGESMKSQASGIASNGDYVALIGVLGTSGGVLRTDIYRSSDKGQTWTSSEMLVDGSSVLAFNGDVTGFLVLKSGRIISWYDNNSDRAVNIIYSDDNGATWSKASVAGSPTDITEPAWVELSDGTIVCMARASVVSGTVDQKIPAKFLKSEDGGLTWSAPVDSTSITNFTLSNGEMIYHDDTETVEFIHHSRNTEDDGYSSLFVATATESDAKNDNFSQQTRIGRLAAYVGPTSPSQGDSGYVAARKSSAGVINVFYYNGNRGTCQINWAIGRKAKGNDREYFIDPFSGEQAGSSGAGLYETILYNGKGENYALNAPLIHGFREDAYKILKTYGSYRLEITGTARVSAVPIGGIDLTDIETLFVSANALSMNSSAIFGFSVYNKENPSTVTDGRVLAQFENFTGRNVISVDVSNLIGLHYPMPMLASNDASASGIVYINQLGFTSNTIKNDDLFGNDLLSTLYDRGNTNDYLSSGWAESHSEGVTSVEFKPDHILLSADSSSGTSKVLVSANRQIDFTNKKLVEITAEIEITGDTVSDAGIAIYSVNPNGGSSTNRLKFRYVRDEGLQKTYLDVRDVNASGYVNVVLNAVDGSVVTVKVLDVKVY